MYIDFGTSGANHSLNRSHLESVSNELTARLSCSLSRIFPPTIIGFPQHMASAMANIACSIASVKYMAINKQPAYSPNELRSILESEQLINHEAYVNNAIRSLGFLQVPTLESIHRNVYSISATISPLITESTKSEIAALVYVFNLEDQKRINSDRNEFLIKFDEELKKAPLPPNADFNQEDILEKFYEPYFMAHLNFFKNKREIFDFYSNNSELFNNLADSEFEARKRKFLGMKGLNKFEAETLFEAFYGRWQQTRGDLNIIANSCAEKIAASISACVGSDDFTSSQT